MPNYQGGRGVRPFAAVAAKAPEVRKLLVALATAASEAIALGLIDGTAEKVTLCALAALGTYGIWRVENADAA